METRKVSAKLLDKHRYINVDYDEWWDYVWEDFQEDMLARGIQARQLYFSGFASQGDGACFDGCVEHMGTFLDMHFKSDEYPLIRRLVKSGGDVTVSVMHMGHYCHSGCTIVSVGEDYFMEVMDTRDPLREATARALDDRLEHEVNAFQQGCTEILRGHMDDLYRLLEQEHDYLTSDEAVTEALLAADLVDEDEDEDDDDED